MTALRAHCRGGPEVLVVERAPVPVPAAGEVLVAVHAAAITFDELTWEETWFRDGVSRTPVIPSHEVSGVVYEIGSEVTDFKPGDEVYGLIRFDRDGAAADFVAVPAADLAAKPSTVPHDCAAALPLAGLTALQALVNHAAVQPGEEVLVHGGAGGVGALTVQLAAILGARVTATVRSDEGELVRGFGAGRVIDVRAEGFDESGAAYDVVIDTVGGQTLDRSFSVLGRGGRLVTLPAAPASGQSRRIRCHGNVFHRYTQSRPACRARRARRQSILERPASCDNRTEVPARQGPGSIRKWAAPRPACGQDRPHRAELSVGCRRRIRVRIFGFESRRKDRGGRRHRSSRR